MNIIQIFDLFPNQEACIKHLEKARWGDKPSCPYCRSTNTARSQHRHRCYNCLTSFSVTVDTIFHHTHLPLQKWFLAISLILNAKKGLSAMQLSRDLQVNKNTAWRVAMQVRKAMNQAEQRHILTGIVEMEEAYIGGKLRKGTKYDSPDDRPKSGHCTKKAPVIGAVERGMFGQFHSVSRKHLQRYVDEFCYRYNLRQTNPVDAITMTINRGLGVGK